ncbi:hypothetical protein CW304_31335 [Bacillus sp. UFRGS-B20]|nr:hypothetical protein CW304_31335 [Bacillus sp. UFRGS-B20]
MLNLLQLPPFHITPIIFKKSFSSRLFPPKYLRLTPIISIEKTVTSFKNIAPSPIILFTIYFIYCYIFSLKWKDYSVKIMKRFYNLYTSLYYKGNKKQRARSTTLVVFTFSTIFFLTNFVIASNFENQTSFLHTRSNFVSFSLISNSYFLHFLPQLIFTIPICNQYVNFINNAEKRFDICKMFFQSFSSFRFIQILSVF